MKRFKRRLSQTLRGSHTIDESLSELAEQMTIEENGLKDSGTFILCQPGPKIRGRNNDPAPGFMACGPE